MDYGSATLGSAQIGSAMGGSSSTDGAPCQRPIDLVHLARYTLGNRALEREILDLYVGQSRQVLANLRAARTDKDWRDAAHALLGSARAVGARDVAERAAIAQKLPGGMHDAQKGPALDAVAVEIERANDYIASLLVDE